MSEEIEKRREKREGTRKNKNQLPPIFTYYTSCNIERLLETPNKAMMQCQRKQQIPSCAGVCIAHVSFFVISRLPRPCMLFQIQIGSLKP